MTEPSAFRPVEVRDTGTCAVPEDFGAAPSLEWISVDRLVLDERYQRPLLKANWTAIRKIAANFSWARFQPIVVSPVEGGRYAIVDGQHRAHAAALCGIEALPAMSCHLTGAEQASAFAWINGNVTRISAFHVLKAAIAAGEPWAVECDRVVRSADCRLMVYAKAVSAKKPGEMYCIQEVRRWVDAAKSLVVHEGLYALRHGPEREEVHLYSAAIIGPWLDAVAELGLHEQPAQLKAFLEDVSLLDVAHRAELLRSQPDWRKFTRRALTCRAMGAKLSEFILKRAA